MAKTPQPLHGMFTAVPPHYDLVNRIITWGMDKGWRRLAAQTCLETKPRSIVDIGCGTGDLTINIAKLAAKGTEITGLDYSPPMLAKAWEKAARAGVSQHVKFIEGQASQLPFPDASIDCAAISFAFRNLTYKNPVKDAHLAEVLRILKPGGHYVVVESSQPENGFIQACFHFYFSAFVLPVGVIISGNKHAYRYLSESVRHYYSPREVRDMLIARGFSRVHYRPLLFGAAGIHVATK